MSDQESSTSASQTEGECEGEMDEELDEELDEEMDEEMEGEGEGDEKQQDSPVPGLYNFSSSLCAVLRIKQKYRAMKKRRQEMMTLQGLGGRERTSPKIFTFDGLIPTASYSSTLSSSAPQRKKRRRRKRVMFPNNRRGCRAPPKPAASRAKYCLYLLCAIVFSQVNTIPT